MGLKPEPLSVWIEPKKPKNRPNWYQNPKNRIDQKPILCSENQKPTLDVLGSKTDPTRCMHNPI